MEVSQCCGAPPAGSTPGYYDIALGFGFCGSCHEQSEFYDTDTEQEDCEND